jgi:hypothetical protein
MLFRISKKRCDFATDGINFRIVATSAVNPFAERAGISWRLAEVAAA